MQRLCILEIFGISNRFYKAFYRLNGMHFNESRFFNLMSQIIIIKKLKIFDNKFLSFIEYIAVPFYGFLLREKEKNRRRCLAESGCLRGERFKLLLPVNGQRTQTNAKTMKSKRRGYIRESWGEMVLNKSFTRFRRSLLKRYCSFFPIKVGISFSKKNEHTVVFYFERRLLSKLNL